LIRRDRPTFGGGIAIYIKDSILYKVKPDFYSDVMENMWIELNTVEGKLLLCNLYRPPNDNEFWDKLHSNLEYVKSTSNIQNIVLLGDLNADFGTVNGNKLEETCLLHNLVYHVDEPTRITSTTRSCLDQILSNVPNFVSSVTVLNPVCTNDHCTVGANLKFRIRSDEAYYRHIWLYDKADYDGFRDCIQLMNWDDCFELDDVDIACNAWSSKFIDIAKSFIPHKRILVRPRDSPWYSCELRKMKRRLIRLYNKAKEKQNDYHWGKYKSFNKEYHDNLDKAESDYNKKLCTSLNDNRNNKRWWSVVKGILGKGKDDSYPPIHNGNIYATSNKEKAELFNKYFLSHSNLDLSNAKLPNDVSNSEFVIENVSATEQEVSDLIATLDICKATGHDDISSRMLKMAGVCIVPSLTRLINMCFVNQKFPDYWKKANVLPLHKKDKRDDCSNYRPVSVLPIVSKIIERIVFKNVYNFFHENNLLTCHQSGFRPQDSTVNQLAYLYHTFSEALDHKKDVRITFCDISKAFDRVWHEGLIFNLRNIGFSWKSFSIFEKLSSQ
jgi:hypothetical protein